MKLRWRWSFNRKISKLNVDIDYQDIVSYTARDFKTDCQWNIILGVFHGFSIPHISKLLCQTGEFQNNGEKRINDTVYLMGQLFFGCRSQRGFNTIKRINQIHRPYKISHESFLYLLSIDACNFLLWAQKYGWRDLQQKEITAWIYQWQQIGIFMNIHGIPGDKEGFLSYIRHYESIHRYFSPENKMLADKLLEIICSQRPMFLRPLIRKAVPAMLGADTCQSLGWEPATNFWTQLTTSILRLRTFLLKLNPVIAFSPDEFDSDELIQKKLENTGPDYMRTKTQCPMHTSPNG